jgi:hypothetical protein
MKILLEFLLGKLEGAINNHRGEDITKYMESCQDCFNDEYVKGNPVYDVLRLRYKHLLRKVETKGL